jgi:hypothetical protein
MGSSVTLQDVLQAILEIQQESACYVGSAAIHALQLSRHVDHVDQITLFHQVFVIAILQRKQIYFSSLIYAQIFVHRVVLGVQLTTSATRAQPNLN